MHKRKTNKLWWIIGVVLLLALGLGSLYLIGSQDHPKTEQTSNSDKDRNASTSKTPSVKTTATQRTSSKRNSKNNSQDVSIPSEFWGTWYDGSKKYAVISANKFIMLEFGNGTAITKDSLPLQLCNDQGPNGSYSIYHNPNPNAAGAEGGDGNSYWIGYLTIDGKKQRVLACYQRQGVFEIYTYQPTSSRQWFQYNGNDYADPIGQSNLDALKAKADSDSADITNNDDKQNDISDKDDSSNQTDMNDDTNTNSTDANQDNSDGDSQSISNNDDNSSSDVSSNSQDDLN